MLNILDSGLTHLFHAGSGRWLVMWPTLSFAGHVWVIDMSSHCSQ